MRDGLARTVPSNAEARILDRLWTDRDQSQQMECRGSGDLLGAREADHHDRRVPVQNGRGMAKLLTGLDGILDRPLTDSAAGV